MPDLTPNTPSLVVFFGADPGLREALRAQLVAPALDLRCVQTVAGLMCAAGKRAVRVLLVDLDCLPPNRTVAAILDRLEAGTGIRPRLFCLVGDGPLGARRSESCREALATFPAPFDADTIAARVSASLAVEATRRQRVLIVDALPGEGDEIQSILRGAGLAAEQLADPQQVIPALERSPTDLILLDLNLPDDASRALAGAIRDHEGLFDLPIVFLSAAISPEHPGEVLRLGGDEYLARPVAADRLLAAVRGRLAEARASAPPERLAAPDGGVALALLTHAQLVKRLDHAILDQPVPALGQAVLFVRFDDSPTLAALDAAGRETLQHILLELVCRQAGAALRGACLGDDGCYAWVRGETNAEIMEVAEGIRTGAASLVLPAGLGLARLCLSVGIGTFGPSVDNALTLISHAEAAGEQARQAGGNRIKLHQRAPRPVSVGGTPNDDGILELLRRALAGSGFRLVYQPILSLRNSHRERYEVLLRLRTPHGEIMPPLTFLPVAGRHGLLPALDRWVLAGALATLRTEQDAGRRTRLMIHQTLASVAEPGWIHWVRDEILRLDLIRQRPVLEFVARDVLADEAQALRVFPELDRLGIAICLAGITDSEDLLALIGRHPIGFVKLARDLVSGGARARLMALVEAVHQRGPRVIAAGIEDPEAIERVWSGGVDYIQGNFIQFPEETLNFQFHESFAG